LLAASAGVGRRVTLGLIRDGQRKDLQLTLTAMPRAVARELTTTPTSPSPPVSNVLGLELETLNDIHRQQLGVPATQPGAVVVGVRPDSPAAESGLEPGDIIITFNDVAIIDAPSCARAIEATPRAALVKLLVIRERETLFFALLKP
jgi:serine protease Do